MWVTEMFISGRVKIMHKYVSTGTTSAGKFIETLERSGTCLMVVMFASYIDHDLEDGDKMMHLQDGGWEKV